MLLINGKIFTMTENRIIENGFIHIKNKKIVEVSEMSSLNIHDCDTLDLEGSVVTPGFIDAHTHIGICEEGLDFEGDDCNEETDPCCPHMRAIDAINPMDAAFQEALSAGITTVLTSPGSANPIGGQIAAIKTYGKRIDDMIVKAPVAFKFALGENPKTVYSDKNESPITRMATAAIIRENLFKAKEYSDNIDKALKDEDCDRPDFDLKLESLIPLIKGEVPAHIHAHRADDIFTAIRIAKEFHLKYAIVHATEGHLIAEELAHEAVDVISGPVISGRTKPELCNLSESSVSIMNKHGICTAVCTDHPVVPLKYLSLCAGIALREGMSEYEVLKTVTINPAKICHIDDRVGSLKSGLDADIAVFDGSPFDLRTKLTHVILNGTEIR